MKHRPRTVAERDLIRWAEERGWKPIGRNGQSHMRMRHASGVVSTIPSALGGNLAAARARLRRKEPK